MSFISATIGYTFNILNFAQYEFSSKLLINVQNTLPWRLNKTF